MSDADVAGSSVQDKSLQRMALVITKHRSKPGTESGQVLEKFYIFCLVSRPTSYELLHSFSLVDSVFPRPSYRL